MFVRVSSIRVCRIPNTTLYEMNKSRDVTRRIDIDPNNEIYWDSVEACSGPHEMIGINSLAEGAFPTKLDWPQSDLTIYEEMTRDAFELWFERAQRFGKRRTHAGLMKAMQF